MKLKKIKLLVQELIREHRFEPKFEKKDLGA